MTFAEAWSLIAAARRILMTTHVKPDGDGLGALAALAEALQARGKDVRVVLPSEVPPKYRFIHGAATFQLLGRDVTLDRLADRWDLLIIIDTCSWQQLEAMRSVVQAQAGRILVIDHHATSDDLGHRSLSDASAAATAPIVLSLIEAAGVPVTPTMAESLFVSLASDTGWFQFPSVTSEVFRLAGRLQDLGAVPQAIYEKLFQSESPAKMQLLAMALPTLVIEPEGDLASFHISGDMFDRAGAEPHDTENLINEAQRIAGVAVSILSVEQEPRVIKVSLRSKRDVDMAAVAMKFGGGGHARAAGCTLRTSLEEARRTVLQSVRAAMGR